MGPALSLRSNQIVAGYASVAANVDVNKIHHDNGVFPGPGAGIEQCPHASAARAAARTAEELAAAAKREKSRQAKYTQAQAATSASATSSKAAAAGCPFHQAATPKPTETSPKAEASKAAPNAFNYEQFYVNELDKKHQDKSYRYFNNINRLAGKFPVAHTGDPKEEVEVWCANDYLGMGNNPVVLESMQ